jgi:hypothetical protein
MTHSATLRVERATFCGIGSERPVGECEKGGTKGEYNKSILHRTSFKFEMYAL